MSAIRHDRTEDVGVDSGRCARGTLEQEIVAALAAARRPMTPAQVRDQLGRDLAYTTVMTVLARLAEKGLVTRERVGRAYAYRAVRDEAEITARQMQRLLDAGDDRAAVLSRFVGVLSDDDEQLLIELLRRAEDPGER
jgi:predicted transcriptional regulator